MTNELASQTGRVEFLCRVLAHSPSNGKKLIEEIKRKPMPSIVSVIAQAVDEIPYIQLDRQRLRVLATSLRASQDRSEEIAGMFLLAALELESVRFSGA